MTQYKTKQKRINKMLVIEYQVRISIDEYKKAIWSLHYIRVFFRTYANKKDECKEGRKTKIKTVQAR